MRKPLIGLLAPVLLTVIAQAADDYEQVRRFHASDAIENDYYGTGVAIDGGRALIGAPGVDNWEPEGRAYLVDLDTGDELHRFDPPIPAREFGYAVALHGDIALIGARAGWGYAYLFDANTGALLHELERPDPTVGGKFGQAVALNDTYAVVGAWFDYDDDLRCGVVYVYDLGTGLLLHRLVPLDATHWGRFGKSVAIDGHTIAVGAENGIGQPDDDDAGTAYLFSAVTGGQMMKLLPTDGVADYFGASVAIDGGRLVVGAELDDDLGFRAGSAYVFDVATGAQLRKLLPLDGVANDHFGGSVAIDGDTIVVGAHDEVGAAYVFDSATGLQQDKLVADDGDAGDNLGTSVAIDGVAILSGAPHNVIEAPLRVGSAYLFQPATDCDADLDGSGDVGVTDLLEILSSWGPCAGCPADIDGDGIVDINDLLNALSAWGACP